MNLIQTFVQQAIHENPEAAAREVPAIIETYATDNTKLNRVKDWAKAVLYDRSDGNAWRCLREAIEEAES